MNFDPVAENRVLRTRSVGGVMGSSVIILPNILLVMIGGGSMLRAIALILAIGAAIELGWSLRNLYTARAKLRQLPIKTRFESAEDRFDELERLKRRDMVTAEEYAAKRQDILKDL
jgi:hypothetical protein